jgi:DNA-binding transcriptional ArsR family regulator
MKAILTNRQIKIAEELVEVLDSIAENMPQDRSVISRHLNLMQEAGILISEKESRHVFYSVNGQPFLEKLVDITEKINECMKECCPDCCK